MFDAASRKKHGLLVPTSLGPARLASIETIASLKEERKNVTKKEQERRCSDEEVQSESSSAHKISIRHLRCIRRGRNQEEAFFIHFFFTDSRWDDNGRKRYFQNIKRHGSFDHTCAAHRASRLSNLTLLPLLWP